MENPLKKSHWGRRVGIVLATTGLACAAFAPMARAQSANASEGPGFGVLPLPGPNPDHVPFENCGEDGLNSLDPLVSRVVHEDVEPIAAGLDQILRPFGFQNYEEAVHAINCSTVVPLENSLDSGNPSLGEFVGDVLGTYYEYVREVCIPEGSDTCLGLILPPIEQYLP